jgi:plastocyanin
MNRFRVYFVLVLILLLAACGGTKEEAEKPAGPPAAIDEVNGATITGKVAFSGEKPVPVTIDMSANPACARAHSTPAKTEQIVVNDNNTLRNVFVWVKSGLAARNWVTPSAPAVLYQDGCIYKPHVLGVMCGQPVEIRNEDLTNHNVHAMPEANEGWNTSQPPKGDPLVRTFARQEVMVPVKCNVHPWMKAYIGVVSHPFFAVTGDDGAFTIKGLPPGTYTLQTWHEKYGTREQQVTVGPKETKTVDFSFKG